MWLTSEELRERRKAKGTGLMGIIPGMVVLILIVAVALKGANRVMSESKAKDVPLEAIVLLESETHLLIGPDFSPEYLPSFKILRTGDRDVLRYYDKSGIEISREDYLIQKNLLRHEKAAHDAIKSEAEIMLLIEKCSRG